MRHISIKTVAVTCSFRSCLPLSDMSIDDLPLEIIQNIFALCCSRPVVIRIPNDTDHQWQWRNTTTQVIISLVCSKWRIIAISTSELWNTVTVVFWASPDIDLDHGLENVQAWLNRAGTSSISLSILIRAVLEEPVLHKIRQSLLSYPGQIRDLDLQSIGNFLVPIDTSCHLQNLSLKYQCLMRFANCEEFPHLPSLPSLKVLRLILLPYHLTDYRNLYAIPWHQLSIFDNSHSYWPSRICLHILQQCQSLIQCTFWMSDALERIQESEVEDDIILPNLEILSLRFGSGSVDHILRPLVLPSIKSLDFMSSDLETPLTLDLTIIEMMARRSGFKRLTTFAIPDTSNPVRVVPLLRYMPALRSIKFGGRVTFDERAFHDLSLGIIGPHLEEMQFDEPKLNEVDIGLLLRTIRARHVYAMATAPGPSQIKPFKSVALRYYYDNADIETLRKEADRCSDESKTQITLVKFSPWFSPWYESYDD
ncbi:hypothetical protein JOM56_005196 [Amanita muscaria]